MKRFLRYEIRAKISNGSAAYTGSTFRNKENGALIASSTVNRDWIKTSTIKSTSKEFSGITACENTVLKHKVDRASVFKAVNVAKACCHVSLAALLLSLLEN